MLRLSRPMLGVLVSTTALLSCRLGLDTGHVGESGLVIPPGCGDGVREGAEECDDGNFDNSDACLEDCRWAHCGDGFVRAQVEVCDDGNLDDTDACTRSCTQCPDADGTYLSLENQHCYTLSQLPNTFTAADQQCRAVSGTLVGFSSAQEHAEITAALPLLGPTWIGLHKPSNISWEWIAGDLELFTNWMPGFPDTTLRVAQFPNGQWQSLPDQALPYLCEVAPGSGWNVRNEDGHAYKHFSASVSWQVAKAECEARDAHLVIIDSVEEFLFVRDLTTVDSWIGLTDQEAEGEFVWVDEQTLAESEFEDWGGTEPSNSGGIEHCVTMLRQWNDLPCSLTRSFVCELE